MEWVSYLYEKIQFEANRTFNNLVSRSVRSFLTPLDYPVQFIGYVTEFILNLLTLNGNIIFLTWKLLFSPWWVELPLKGKENHVSVIGHLDRRKDLEKDGLSSGIIDSWKEGDEKPLMDLCLMASKLAYENRLVVRSVVIFNWKMHFVGFFDGWNDFRQKWSTQVFIITDKPKKANLILVSFSGTKPFDVLDWTQNLDSKLFQHKDRSFEGRLNVGILEYLGLGNRKYRHTLQYYLQEPDFTNAIQMTKRSAYCMVREKLKSLLGPNLNPDAKIVITGHGIGGAQAIMFPTVLAIHGEEDLLNRIMSVVTFGQPRIGDQKWKEFMTPVLMLPKPKYYRVVYSYDVVPSLPFDFNSRSYRHMGLCYYYDIFFRKHTIEEVHEHEESYWILFALPNLILMYVSGAFDLVRSFVMGSIISNWYGDCYVEGWFSLLIRITGLLYPGFAGHMPVNYTYAVRYGKYV